MSQQQHDWAVVLREAHRLAGAYPSLNKLADAIDIPRSTFKDALARRGITLEVLRAVRDPETSVPSTTTTSYLQEWEDYRERLERRPSWREIVEHARQSAAIQAAFRPDIGTTRRRIITDGPVFVTFASDFHLGSPHVDYGAFLETSDLLISHPDFYLIVVGPDLEAGFKQFPAADVVLNQVVPPYQQIEMYHAWLDEMLPRMLAICGDTHVDQRLERYFGDIGLVWRDDLPYFSAWGLLEVEVGPEDGPTTVYEMIIAHEFKGRSGYHGLQPCLRLMRDIYPLAHIYATGHIHRPWYMRGCFYPEVGLPDQHLVVAGTFKTGADSFTLRKVGPRGVLGVPVLQLWPDKRQIVYYPDPAVALEATGRL